MRTCALTSSGVPGVKMIKKRTPKSFKRLKFKFMNKMQIERNNEWIFIKLIKIYLLRPKLYKFKNRFYILDQY